MPPVEFELVTSFQVIELVADPHEFLRACARQTRTGGRVAVVTALRARPGNRLYRVLPVRVGHRLGRMVPAVAGIVGVVYLVGRQ